MSKLFARATSRLSLFWRYFFLLCGDIVLHIKDNFSDPALCLFNLARLFCVSERFAHNAIPSLTGMNFSNFLSLTRMQEAARLLRETDESIQQ